MLSTNTMWSKKKDEESKKVETFSNRNTCFNDEIIESEDGFSQYSCTNHHLNSYTFLNFCHLCHKPLRGKEIYMYRGEMGFCSDECRNRQMYLDDMKKIEISTRRILASFRERRRNGGGRCESGRVVRDVPAAVPPLFMSK